MHASRVFKQITNPIQKEFYILAEDLMVRISNNPQDTNYIGQLVISPFIYHLVETNIKAYQELLDMVKKLLPSGYRYSLNNYIMTAFVDPATGLAYLMLMYKY